MHAHGGLEVDELARLRARMETVERNTQTHHIEVRAWNTWKNRNLTKASQEAQQITDMIKNGEVMVDEIVEVIQGFKDRSTKGNESAEG